MRYSLVWGSLGSSVDFSVLPGPQSSLPAGCHSLAELETAAQLGALIAEQLRAPTPAHLQFRNIKVKVGRGKVYVDVTWRGTRIQVDTEQRHLADPYTEARDVVTIIDNIVGQGDGLVG